MERRGKSTVSHSLTPNRGKVSSSSSSSFKGMESPKPLVSLSAVKTTPQSVKKQNSNVNRSLTLNVSKSRDDVIGIKKSKDSEHVRVSARTGNCNSLKQFPQRQQLQEKLCLAENLIKDLESELLILKEELRNSQSLNFELQSHNDRLVRDLALAEAKLAKGSIKNQRNLEATNESGITQNSSPSPSNSCQNLREAPPTILLPPPPPPPPPPQTPLQSPSRKVATQKSPDLIRLFHSLRNKEGKRDSQLLGKPAVINVHNSIVGEIQNRSAHLLAIKADIETKGEFINGLIDKVLVATYTDIEDVLKFVDWLDSQLSSLADERAVLKHFKWPESKADAMREAAIEYRALKLLESEISLYKDDTSTPCEAALKKMASLLDKSERSIQRLIRLRNTVIHTYQDLKLPTNWMLDSGITSKIKQASMNLAKMYMIRVKTELDSIRSSDKESNQESLLLKSVHFAYKTHQFAGGLDSETLCAFEEIKQWVPRQVLGGSHSQGWIVGIPSS